MPNRRISMRKMMRMSKAHTAVFLTGIAAGLQIVFTIVAILGFLGLSTFIPIPGLGMLLGFVGFSGIVLGVVWSFLDYGVIYLETKKGRLSAISNVILVAGVLQLAFGATVPGVLILLAWAMEQK